jgi:hypothetical protein
MKTIFAPVGRSKATKRDKSSLYRSIGTCWTSVSSVESLAPEKSEPSSLDSGVTHRTKLSRA